MGLQVGLLQVGLQVPEFILLRGFIVTDAEHYVDTGLCIRLIFGADEVASVATEMTP